jgi:hypothetical protein
MKISRLNPAMSVSWWSLGVLIHVNVVFQGYYIMKYPSIILVSIVPMLMSAESFAEDGPVNVDVALVMTADKSSSVDYEIADRQRLGHAQALKSVEFLDAVQSGANGCIAVTYIEWSGVGSANYVLPWSTICNKEQAETAAQRIADYGDPGYGRARGGRTSISYAIEIATQALEQWQSRTERTVIDISTNGENNDGASLSDSRDKAVAAGHVINAIALTSTEFELGELSTYLEGEVIGGRGSFVARPDNVADYQRALLRKIMLEISALPSRTVGPLEQALL